MRGAKQRGNTFVEFALSAGVLMLVLGGVFQFGYAIYLYCALASNVSHAARHAARMEYDSRSATSRDNAARQVQNYAVYGNAEGTGSPLIPNLTPAQINVEWRSSSGGAIPDEVTVTVGNYHVNALFNQFDFTGKPRVTMPYVGLYLS